MYAKLYLIGTCCGILAYRLQMITRIEIYFDFFSVVALPAIYECNASYKDGSESTLLYLLNRYILPAMILIIFLGRYYSFFTAPIWEKFHQYHCILFS